MKDKETDSTETKVEEDNGVSELLQLKADIIASAKEEANKIILEALRQATAVTPQTATAPLGLDAEYLAFVKEQNALGEELIPIEIRSEKDREEILSMFISVNEERIMVVRDTEVFVKRKFYDVYMNRINQEKEAKRNRLKLEEEAAEKFGKQ